MMLFALLLVAQSGESPAAFVHRAYTGYQYSGYSPLRNPEKLFSPPLTAAIRKDGSDDEVGYLDGDPLCDCQDFERLSARIVSLSRPTARSATVRVRVTVGPNAVRNLKLSLVLTGTGWRISDIIDPRGHSLLRELQRSNAGR
jgi:hypothetical protein